MSKRHAQKRPAWRPGNQDIAVTAQVSARPESVATPAPGESPARYRWLALVGIVGLAVGLVFAVNHLRGSLSPGKNKKTPQSWEAKTEADKIVERFVRLRHKDEEAALALLGPPAVFDGQPVSKEKAAAMQTDFYLRSMLVFKKVLRGVPDGNGKQLEVAGAVYTLTTSGNPSPPLLRIREADGTVGPLEGAVCLNPDLVVEVRDGKIYGLRHELHMGP